MTQPESNGLQIMIVLNIDPDLLRQQKQWLLLQEGEPAEELLCLIDAIQDHLIDECGVPEEIFQDLSDDDEQ